MKSLALILLFGLLYKKVDSARDSNDNIQSLITKSETDKSSVKSNYDSVKLYDRILHRFYRPYQVSEDSVDDSRTVNPYLNESTESSEVSTNDAIARPTDENKATQPVEQEVTESTEAVYESSDEVSEKSNQTNGKLILEENANSIGQKKQARRDAPDLRKPLILKRHIGRRPFVFKRQTVRKLVKRQTMARKPLILLAGPSHKFLNIFSKNNKQQAMDDDEEDIVMDDKMKEDILNRIKRQRKYLSH